MNLTCSKLTCEAEGVKHALDKFGDCQIGYNMGNIEFLVKTDCAKKTKAQ